MLILRTSFLLCTLQSTEGSEDVVSGKSVSLQSMSSHESVKLINTGGGVAHRSAFMQSKQEQQLGDSLRAHFCCTGSVLGLH